jgi:hypothetical protein
LPFSSLGELIRRIDSKRSLAAELTPPLSVRGFHRIVTNGDADFTRTLAAVEASGRRLFALEVGKHNAQYILHVWPPAWHQAELWSAPAERSGDGALSKP